MIEIADTSPDVNVLEAEYLRLLGYPRGHVLQDRALELTDWARCWYSKHGRPWVYARQIEHLDAPNGIVTIDGTSFASGRLSGTLRDAGAQSAVLVAVSAGPEVEQQARVLWDEGKPDEYFFLEIFGSAVVEHLVTMTGARLCAWAESAQMAVLPHYSPGYPDWPIEDQAPLLDLIRRARGRDAVAIDVLESGMLRPKKSLLAVFGVTRHVDRVARLTGLTPCENCSFAPCQYRRAPYRHAPRSSNPELAAIAANERAVGVAVEPLDRNARYTVNAKALRRWSDERLVIDERTDGTLSATFRYEGTTCTNMGRPLKFDYHVTLGSRDEGYPIHGQHCAPAPGDDGHTHMCRYLIHGDELLATIEDERPLNGQRLNGVLTWERPASAAGCYCDAESRLHKWGLVLETIHFALTRMR